MLSPHVHDIPAQSHPAVPPSRTASATERATALADISPICEIFDEALLAVGVRGLMTDVFATEPFELAFRAAVAAKHARINVTNDYDIHMTLRYWGEDVPESADPVHLWGGLWWLRHWLGA